MDNIKFKTFSFTIISIIICILLTSLIIFWISLKFPISIKSRNSSKKITSYFKNNSSISNVNNTNYNLNDYYVKSAFNCCATGSLKNSFVHINALETCIKQGVRCLDFEIYSLDNKPVIAISSTNSYYIKESFNHIDFTDALIHISNRAFSGSYSPNPNDPLILHFRIKTRNKEILNKMANSLSHKLGSRLLGRNYSYENNRKNLGKTSLKDLLGKVIIIVDKSYISSNGTKLNEYVNISGNSPFMRCIPFHDVKFSHDIEELINYNKQNMTLCHPDIKVNIENPDSRIAKNTGCQFIAMSFQNINNNLKFYNKMFEDEGSAFILKPDNLRHIPKFITKPEKPKKELSYSERIINEPSYSFKI